MAPKEPLAYWRGLFELISDLKATSSDDYIANELSKVEQQLLHGLNYFKYLTKDKQIDKDGSVEGAAAKKSKDSKLNSVVKKLSNLIRLDPTQTWEVLSNYLLYAFRGPAESLKKILISEFKVNAVLSDMFCFYYRERMFLLKSFSIILTAINNGGQTPHHAVYKKVLDKLSFSRLYESLIKQLEAIRNTEPPDSMSIPSANSGGSISASSLVNFWREHNLLEQVEILKLMILITPYIEPCMKDMDTLLCIILKSGNAKRPGVLSKYDSRKQLLLKSMWDLEVIHFIQLLSFDKLPGESIWCNENLFNKMDNSIRHDSIVYSYHYEGTSAILVSWLLTTYLTPFGMKDIASLQELGLAVKQSNPWAYFNKFLTSQIVMDEPAVSKLVNKAVYEVLFLTISNFGLDFVKDEPSIYTLTATLVKDDSVAECLWTCKNEGLILILEEAEMWFPAVWKPTLDILMALSVRGKSDCLQVLERLENKLKYCQKQTVEIDMGMVRANVFQNKSVVKPLQCFPDVVIPCKTECTITTLCTPGNAASSRSDTGNEATFVHWNITLPFWRIVLNDIKLLHLQMIRTPGFIESDLRERVIGLFKLSQGILKNSSVISNDMILAMEEVFNIINRNCAWGRNQELDLLTVCLEISTCLIPLFPADILNVFEPLKFLPGIDHVVMTHIQCVQGIHYHGNYIKTLLELVEIKSGKFSLLISYLEFIHTLFKIEQTKVSWASLAGLMFVLRDVFPHYQTWYYVDENERVEIGWLCVQLLHVSLNGSQEELSPPQTSVPLYSGTNPTPSSGPTFNLIANTCLYSLLNKDGGLSLIRIVAIGEQRLFDMVEKFPSWNSGKSAVLVNTVHLALSVLNRIILYKVVQQDPSALSPTEEEIYKEPKDTDHYHCVLNVASYIHHSFNPKLRILACRLLTRFADNTRLSLMLCTGLEPYTIRDMFLQPLYSDCESSQLKVAILQFIAKCIQRQASLAEAFLNVLELKECMTENREQEGDNSGVLTFALAVIDNEVGAVTDPVYHATVQLLHALWLEQCSVVISYLRMRKGFWKNLCKPLFSEPREDVPVYTSILNILSTEFYWFGKDVNSNLDDVMKKFLCENSECLLKWSLLCTNPSGHILSAAKKRNQQSEELVIAWREFVVTVAKFLPDLIADQHKEMLAIHLLNGLSAEMASLLNMGSIISLSEAYAMLLTTWKEHCCNKKKEVAISQMVRVLAQLSHHYTYIHPKAIATILTFSARLLDTGPPVLPKRNEGELLMRSVCDIMAREIGTFMDKCWDVQNLQSSDKSRQHLTLALCLALRLQSLIENDSSLINSWTHILRTTKLIQRLISAVAAALKNQIEPKLCMFMLEFLLALTSKGSLFMHIDMFDLHYYIWENIPSLNPSYSSDKQMMNESKVSEWKPVYCRGLDLVTFLIENNNYKIKTSTYDFIELHGDYLRELLVLLEVSNDDADFELVSSGLRLLNYVAKGCNFHYTNYAMTTYGLSESVYQCLKTVVNLILHPNTLVSQFFVSSSRKLLPFDQKPLDQKVVQKVQKAQVKLVNIYCECISVLNQNYSIDFCDIISADRISVPPWALQPPVNYSTPVEDFSPVLNAINFFTKVLTKNIRAVTPVGASDDLNVALSKLSEVDHDDIRFALEISAYFLISHILLIIVDDRLTFRQKQLFSRDLSSEVNILLEYARRVSTDPTLHVLSVDGKRCDKTGDSSTKLLPDDHDVEIVKPKPLHWTEPPPSSGRISADDTLDGIHYLDESDAAASTSSKDKTTSSGVCISGSQLQISVTEATSGTLPMDFLAFAAKVFQLVFKMSEK